MKKQWMTTVVTITIAMMLGMFTGSANAADKYSAGAITWATGTDVWSTTSGGSYTGPWVSGDSATFEGTAGTVALGEDISVSNITFNTGNYTISGHTLNFVSGGTIDHAVNSKIQKITSAITGSPDVRVTDGGATTELRFEPVSGSVELGAVTLAYESGFSTSCKLFLGGGATTTGTAVSITNNPANWYCNVEKIGASTWTVGKLDVGFRGYIFLDDGILIANGAIGCRTLRLLSPAQLHINNATWTVADYLQILGGSLDNSSGSAIVLTNPKQQWGGDWTFIGSNGSDSDLTVGTGTATLTGTRTVTIQNAATTLTVGGTVTDDASVYGLTKAGAGTLALTGTLDYNGNTTVNAGTLSIGNGTTTGDLDDDAQVSIAAASGAKIDLNFSGTDDVFALNFDGTLAAVGTWGAVGNGSATYTTNALTGSGVLNNGGGLAPAGTWYWDGPNTGGNGDGASDGGAGTWSTANANWDQGLVTRKVWNNTTADQAIFRASAGTVDLQSDITLGGILIDGVNNYTIGGNTETYSLNFGGTSTITVDGVSATIRAGITGSPDISPNGTAAILYLTPDVDMAIGDIHTGADLYLEGSTTDNSASSIQATANYRRCFKNGASTWTVGDVVGFDKLELNDGRLVINGTKHNGSNRNRYGILWTGAATLAGTGTIDDTAEDDTVLAVPVGGTLAPGDPTGTLTVTNNNCTIEGTLTIEVNGASYSTLAVDPAYTLTIGAAAILDINVTSASGPVVIATYGSLVGNPFPTENIPVGWTIDYGAMAITLNPPPAGTVLIIE